MSRSTVTQYAYVDPRNASQLQGFSVDEKIARADALKKYFPTLEDDGIAELTRAFGETVLFGEESGEETEDKTTKTHDYLSSIPFKYIEEMVLPPICFGARQKQVVFPDNGEINCIIRCGQSYFYVEVLVDSISSSPLLENIGICRYDEDKSYNVYDCVGFDAYLKSARKLVLFSQYVLDKVQDAESSGAYLGATGNHALFTESPIRLANDQLRELTYPLTIFEAPQMKECAQESWMHPIRHDKLMPSVAYSIRTKIAMAVVAIAIVVGWIVFEAFAAFYRWQVSFGVFQNAPVWLIGLFGFTSLLMAGLAAYTLKQSWHSQQYYEPKHLLYTVVSAHTEHASILFEGHGLAETRFN